MRIPFLLLVICGVALAAENAFQANITPSNDGQPGCAVRYEFRRLWRNNVNPEIYWECTRWRSAARQRHCPSGTRFQDSWQTCVPFNQWQWTPHSDPPTQPGCGEIEECEEIEITPEPGKVCPTVCPGTTIAPITSTGTTGTTMYSTGSTMGPYNTTESTRDPSSSDSSTVTASTETTMNVDSGENSGGQEIEPMGLCPGASDNQHDPGNMTCAPLDCTIPEWQNGTLYPTRDPTFFYQCAAGEYQLKKMPCAPGTCFSFKNQVCIHAYAWRNDCA